MTKTQLAISEMARVWLPEGFVSRIEELCEESEGVSDLACLWLEAEGDPSERTECEIDLFAMIVDRWIPEVRADRIDEIIGQAEDYGVELASAQTQVPKSVLSYLLQRK